MDSRTNSDLAEVISTPSFIRVEPKVKVAMSAGNVSAYTALSVYIRLGLPSV